MTRNKTKVLLAGSALVLVLAAALPATAAGSNGAPGAQPNWRPTASEKLVKLPAGYLKKTLDYDFAQSELARRSRISMSKSASRPRRWVTCRPPPNAPTAIC